jgi:predicted RNA-binding Zn ribbon-like protein
MLFAGYVMPFVIPGQVNFGSHAGRVVHTAVALVNALTPGLERGRPVPGLTPDLRLARARRVLEISLTQDEAELVTRLAADLRPVFVAIDDRNADTAAALVNDLLRQYRPAPYLARHDGERWHLHFRGDRPGAAAGWGAGCAMALAAVLGGESWDRLGLCSAPACDRVFVDLSRNGSRRFCSTACQNRTKAAALRARRRALAAQHDPTRRRS